MDKVKRILFVCTGNTCRSSMAEALLKYMLEKNHIENVEVFSAGTGVFYTSGASEYAVEVMKEKGIDLSFHRSKQVTDDMLLEADLILTMTESHKKTLLRINPGVADKVFTLKEFAYGPYEVDDTDISDPFGLSKNYYEQCGDEIVQALQMVIEKIKKDEF